MSTVKKKKFNVNDDTNVITKDNYKDILKKAAEYKECYIPVSIQAPLRKLFVAEAAKVHVTHGTDFNFVWMDDSNFMYNYYDYVGLYTTRKLSNQELVDKFGGKLITAKIMEDGTKNLVARINRKLTSDGKIRVMLYRYSATRPELWDFKKNYEIKEFTHEEIVKARYSFRPFMMEEVGIISTVTGVDYTKKTFGEF